MPGKMIGGVHKAYSRPEIVVAYKHTDRVRRELRNLKIKHVFVESDRYLGLSLIALDNDVAAAVALKDFDAEWEETFGTRRLPKGPTTNKGTSDYLDSFLRGLRRYFVEHYSGWTPTVGKNRVIGLVTTTPGTVWHGGGGPLDTSRQRLPKRKGAEGAGVVVGILDTGIGEVDWLAGGWTTSVDGVFKPVVNTKPLRQVDEKTLPNGAAGHGTFVAGLILAQAPAAVVKVKRVLANDGTATSWQVATKLAELARAKPDIINLSLVCYTEDGEPPLVLATAIDRIPPETVVVAAAGNHGDMDQDDMNFTLETLTKLKEEAGHDPAKNTRLRRRLGVSKEEYALPLEELMEILVARERRKPSWPAAFERVVAVGSGRPVGSAVGEPGGTSDFTPSGVGWIDALADGEGPDGEGVISTYPPGDYSAIQDDGTVTKVRFRNGFAIWGGTSFAAANVSGMVAARTKPGNVSARQALELMLTPAEPTPEGRVVPTTPRLDTVQFLPPIRRRNDA